MGTPISATVVYNDGQTRDFPDVSAALALAREGRVELHYAYDPSLLPAPGTPRFDLWRYRPLLPLGDGPIHYPLSVGGTPLVASPALRERLGLPQLWLKDETRGPTGSNKDRASALVLELALRERRDTVSCASTGNVAVSLAVGAAAAGRRAVIFVPAQVSPSNLTLMLLAGATVVKVRAGYKAAFRLSEEAAERFGWFSRNTGVNPVTLEAKKTVAFEVWEQLNRDLPDVVVAPVGDGVTLAALAKGFRELIACGVTARLPRIIGVQAEGSAPIARAWATDRPLEAIEPNTLADGIAVGAPVSAGEVLRDVRASGGGMVTVSDETLLDWIGILAREAGLLAEPAGVAGTAGVAAALEQGLLDRSERVVALVSGTLLKNLQFARPTRKPIEVEGELGELERALG